MPRQACKRLRQEQREAGRARLGKVEFDIVFLVGAIELFLNPRTSSKPPYFTGRCIAVPSLEWKEHHACPAEGPLPLWWTGGASLGRRCLDVRSTYQVFKGGCKVTVVSYGRIPGSSNRRVWRLAFCFLSILHLNLLYPLKRVQN